jgi:hypothetical protein
VSSERSEEPPHFVCAVVFAFAVAFGCHPSPQGGGPAVVAAVAVVFFPDQREISLSTPSLTTIFVKNSPKIACQAPKTPKNELTHT